MRPPGIKNNYSDYKDLRLLDFCPVMTNYDIVLLQEMFSTLTTRKCRLKIAAAKCGFSHFAESPSPKLLSGHIVDGGLLTLSKHPILKHKFYPYKLGVHSDGLAQKGILYTLISCEDTLYHIFNTHSQASYEKNFGEATKLSFLVRFSQMIELRKFIDETVPQTLGDHEMVLLGGDLNIDQHSSPLPHDVFSKAFPKDLPTFDDDVSFNEYDLFLKMFKFEGKFLVHDLLLEKSLSKHLPQYTFGDFSFDEEGNKVPCETVLTVKDSLTEGSRLDYLIELGRPGGGELLKKVQACEINKLLIHNKPYTQLSDHYALELELVNN